jgi:DNA-directed RNA polymerase subunit RPC12/RpoP
MSGFNRQSEELVISSRDILFECPSCGKSLVVDEAAQGLTIECPQCHINVIVPPKPHAAVTPPPSSSAASGKAATPAAAAPPSTAQRTETSDMAALHQRLVTLANQFKEVQTQWTEVTNRVAAHINEINRELISLGRLETSQKQILSEWNHIVAQIAAATQTPSDLPKPPVVLGSSVGRTRVSFGS